MEGMGASSNLPVKTFAHPSVPHGWKWNIHVKHCDTVDGRNRAPGDMVHQGFCIHIFQLNWGRISSMNSDSLKIHQVPQAKHMLLENHHARWWERMHHS